MTGRLGAEGSKDELGAFLCSIGKSIVLRHTDEREFGKMKTKSPKFKDRNMPITKVNDRVWQCDVADAKLNDHSEELTMENEKRCIVMESEGSCTSTNHVMNGSVKDEENELCSTNAVQDGSIQPTSTVECGGDHDDDAFNPFADSFRRTNGIATDSEICKPLSIDRSSSSKLNEIGSLTDTDSPVSLSDYECLEMDAIPNYVAFKPSVLSRRQQLRRNGNYRQHEEPKSVYSDGVLSPPRRKILEATNDVKQEMTSELSRSNPEMSTPTSASLTRSDPNVYSPTHRTSRMSEHMQLRDLNFPYDMQREIACNPFLNEPYHQNDQVIQLESLVVHSELFDTNLEHNDRISKNSSNETDLGTSGTQLISPPDPPDL